MRIIFCVLLFSCCGLFVPASSLAFSRAQMPLAYYARQADLVIVSDVTKPQAPDYKFTLTVREVLQGNAQVGQEIDIPQSRSVASFILPHANTTAAVFLKKDEKGQWDVLESRSQPDDVAALRVLIPLFQLPDERQQITGLQKAVRQAPTLALFSSELAAALREMRQPNNFDLIESSLPLLNAKQRENMMRILGAMNDLRAVPVLLAALNEPDKVIQQTAAHTLTYYYPGAPGVGEAMRAILRDEKSSESLKRTAQDYLSKRDASVKVEWTPEPYHQAKALFQSDDAAKKATGALALLRVMEDKNSGIFAGTSIIAWTGEEILPFLKDDEKARLRALLLRQAAQQNNYLEAEYLIKLMRKMPHPDFIPALQKLMHDMTPSELPYSMSRADMLSTFALLDLGEEARQQGAQQVMENIKQRLQGGQKARFLEGEILLRQLAWLADEKTWQSALAQINPQWQREWEKLNALRPALNASHQSREREGQQLVALLENPPEQLNIDVRDWVIYRLGELGERDAVEPLLKLLPQMIGHYPHSAKEALIQIGGSVVDEGAIKLLRHENLSVRKQAMEILRELRGEKMRSLLREILAAPNEAPFGNKGDAALMLGAIGTPEDLPVLSPYADFWKADRAVQQWALSSLASIRERFHYDLNGPIQNPG